MKTTRLAIQILIPMITLIVVNLLFPINFTLYFILCALALLWSFFTNGNETSWSIVVTLSILVTLNYLRPEPNIYNNADHNVIALKEYSTIDVLKLVDSKNPKSAMFDNEELEGTLSVKPGADNACILEGVITSQPLFIKQSKQGLQYYSLANKGNLISFKNDITFKKGDHSLRMSFKIEADTLGVSISFIDSLKSARASFNKIINEGYPLVDIVRSAGNCSPNEESFLKLLQDVLIVRDTIWINKKENPTSWCLTTTQDMRSSISVECDGIKSGYSIASFAVNIDPSQRVHIGIGGDKTSPVYFSNNDGRISMTYDMPRMFNFPPDHGCSNNIAVISSSAEDLLSSSVKEAFYYDTFTHEDNHHHFSGTITYQTSPSPAPLKVNIIDNKVKEAKTLTSVNKGARHYYLTTKGDKEGRWNISIIDLRKISPITGNNNFWINDWTNISIILIAAIITLLCLYFVDRGKRVFSIFHVWLFLIPILTQRLYLLWRIAVFPPVRDISKVEFLRYRMENGLMQNAMVMTLLCLMLFIIGTVAIIIYKEHVKRNGGKLLQLSEKGSIRLFIALSATACVTHALHGLFGTALGNIVVPVLVFFVNEFLCINYIRKTSILFRIFNALLTLALILHGDPGYAIMFFIFESIYFIIQMAVFTYSNTGKSYGKNAANKVKLLLALFVGLLVISAPYIVSLLYSKNSALYFLLISIVISAAILRIIHINYGKKVALKGVVIALPIIIAATFGGPEFLESKPHFKYRSQIHTQSVGEIMINEDIQKRDSQRLLEASQNQWFLQYHENLGQERIRKTGIINLQSHFRKGVSWNTQISDVICSRYMIAEQSLLLPLVIVLLCFSLLFIILKMRNSKAPNKSIAYGIALLLLVQSTFVWMANTNRMIFFGQDFPFMSQNAKATLIMFFVMLLVLALTSISDTDDMTEDYCGISLIGFHAFSNRPLIVFSIIFISVFSIVFATGNKYSKIYQTNKATVFNAGEAMMQAEADFEKINLILSTFHARKSLTNGENLTEIWDTINESINIDSEVKRMYDSGIISKFSYSLYTAFYENQMHENRTTNIVHLQYNVIGELYKLVINNGFYSLRAPEMQEAAWKGDIYAYDIKNTSNHLRIEKSNKDNVTIYRVPATWLRDSSANYGIVDTRMSDNSWEKTLCSNDGDRDVPTDVFVIKNNEVLECTNTDVTLLHLLEGNTENLLAKNMLINGQNRFFYPMGEEFFWIKNFAEMLASNVHNNENCTLTIDKDLQKSVYRIMKSTQKTLSVIAMDGLGNIRLMSDIHRNSRYNPDPNNTKQIEELVEYSYLNPNPSEDKKIFGNMNLVYMLPGPGSSLKPITYAAVTSQTNKINWSSLKLHQPEPKFGDSRYYYMLSFGPSYKYSSKWPFKSLYGDETTESGWIDVNFYLRQSSNYYNALVTYLGNFSVEDFSNISHIIKPVNGYSDFPSFQLNGRTYAFRTAPSKDRDNSILNTGLAQNFKMNVVSDFTNNHEGFITKDWLGDAKASNHPWVFPAASTAYIKDFGALTESQWLKQYTLGSSPLRITPIMMAEMYGRLFSLHPDYQAHIIENTQRPTDKWDSEQHDIFSFYKNSVYQGMKDCVLNGTATGTLKGVDTHNGKYHLYAKTGTLTIRDDIDDDKMLAVVITNKDITKISDPENCRFFVVYFRYQQTSLSNVHDIINEIMESQSFEQYMNY